MNIAKFKQIYSIKDELAGKIIAFFGLGDSLTRDQVLMLDEFLEWKDKESLSTDEAIQLWDDYKAEQVPDTGTLDLSWVESVAIAMAEQSITQIPQLAAEQNAKMRAAFIATYKRRIMEVTNNPDFQQQMSVFVETGDLGKLPAILSSRMLPGSN